MLTPKLSPAAIALRLRSPRVAIASGASATACGGTSYNAGAWRRPQHRRCGNIYKIFIGFQTT